VRKNFVSLLERLGQHLGQGLEELTLTTNGTLLEQYAQKIADCGVKRINVSLDTLNPDTFRAVTRLGNINEVMPMGETDEDRFDQYVPMATIREDLEKDWTLVDHDNSDPQSGPSRYVSIKETGGRLGFITPLTQNFCAGCNRVRVTCTGRIYMCLGQDDYIDLRSLMRENDYSKSVLDKALDDALFKKPEKHDFEIKRPDSTPAVSRHMSMTGG